MPNRISDALAQGTSRRGFLARTGRALTLLAGAGTVTALIEPGESEAYHFCGHTYTTDSCPHPTGLPRVDARGFPLRAADGARIDDLGRPIDRQGRPIDDRGHLLTDPDGRPLPPAPRSRICADGVPREFGHPAQIDGSWYRCCGGQVRKLTDCCTYSGTRINGDSALTGYCYGGRKVFCVMYYQTKVPC